MTFMDEFDMSQSSPAAGPNTRKSDAAPRNWQQMIVSRLAGASLDTISEAIGKDVSVASRLRSGEARVTFNEALEVIGALGCKCVDMGAVCVRRDRYEAISSIARAALTDQDFSHRLIWDEG